MWVISQDIKSFSLLDEIKDNAFSALDKEFTMKLQFNNCSYRKFQILSYSGTRTKGVETCNSGIEVWINNTAIGAFQGDIVNETLFVAEGTLGKLNQFDFVIMFLLTGALFGGSNNWKVCAFVNKYFSVHNDACS